MASKKKLFSVTFAFTLSSLFLTSCGGWTEKEKSQFIESCEVLNLERAYCDCVLEKAMTQYSSMAEINNDEKAMAEILVSADCLEKSEGTEVAE
jgi:hypothetical protein